jgi:predicted metal-dependent phosphotriesterase family hydrolase
MIPSLYQPVADPFETVKTIQAIGADRCIVGSDFGQSLHVNTIDGIRIFIRALLSFGITKEQIKVMIADNPARLMYLDG